MRPKVKIFLVLFILLLSYRCTKEKQTQDQPAPKMYTAGFASLDGLEISADIYPSSDGAPLILLFHQARYSRGEYREIALELQSMGYTCIATDQRSGEGVNGVENETARRAREAALDMHYMDAMPDVQAAISYALQEFNPSHLFIWGSSYSASLALMIASQDKYVDAVLAFSPGDYFKWQDRSINTYLAEISCPVFMTCSQEEAPSRQALFELVGAEQKTFFVPTVAGYHGSKALWKQHAGHEAYWEAVKAFLEQVSS